jgi:hypothetical protein
MKYIVSESQIEEFLKKCLDLRDDQQKCIYLNLMELAKELMTNEIDDSAIPEIREKTRKILSSTARKVEKKQGRPKRNITE